jgi:hypothetical protein
MKKIEIQIELLGKLRLGGLWFQASLCENGDPISKITTAKSAGGMAQVIEHLPSKHKALTPVPPKNKK